MTATNHRSEGLSKLIESEWKTGEGGALISPKQHPIVNLTIEGWCESNLAWYCLVTVIFWSYHVIHEACLLLLIRLTRPMYWLKRFGESLDRYVQPILYDNPHLWLMTIHKVALSLLMCVSLLMFSLDYRIYLHYSWTYQILGDIDSYIIFLVKIFWFTMSLQPCFYLLLSSPFWFFGTFFQPFST